MQVARTAIRYLWLALPAALALLLVSRPSIQASSPVPLRPLPLGLLLLARSSMPDLAGSYRGRAAPNDVRRGFLLQLDPNGRAVLRTLYVGNNDTLEQGHWSQDGAKLVLTFDPIGQHQPPRPITFHYHHRALRPIDWDPSEWGRNGPPILYRESHKTSPTDT